MKRTSQQVRQFVKDSGISLLEFKSLTGLSSSQVMRWCAGDDGILKERHIKNFEEGLCTKVENLCNKILLNKCFFENFRGEKIGISEVYVEEARSFVRSSCHIIRYLELMFGQARVRCILKEMSVHHAYFDELNNKINILFFVDLLEKCKSLGLSKNDLRSVAGALFLSIEGTESEKLFKACTNHKDAYENIKNVVSFFDTNFYYDFKVKDTSVTIVSEPHEAVSRMLQKIPVDYLFHYRRQVFGTVPRMCGLSDIDLTLDRNLKPTSFTQIYHGQYQNLSNVRSLRLL